MGFPPVQAGVALGLGVPELRFSHPDTPARSPASRGLWLVDTSAERGLPAAETAQDREDVANGDSARVGCARLLTSVPPCGPMGLAFPSRCGSCRSLRRWSAYS